MATLELVIDTVKKLDPQPDFIVFTGMIVYTAELGLYVLSDHARFILVYFFVVVAGVVTLINILLMAVTAWDLTSL